MAMTDLLDFGFVNGGVSFKLELTFGYMVDSWRFDWLLKI